MSVIDRMTRNFSDEKFENINIPILMRPSFSLNKLKQRVDCFRYLPVEASERKTFPSFTKI